MDDLRVFQKTVRTADLRINAKFQEIIRQAQDLLEISDRDMATAFFVSRPTVNRWINGRNLPYLAARKHAANWIVKQISSKLRTHHARDLVSRSLDLIGRYDREREKKIAG